MTGMVRCLATIALSACWMGALAQTHDVPPELWDRPRTGAALLGEESVKRAVLTAIAQPDAQLVIHHAPGQEREVQAAEIRSWLGALAIDPRRIALRADLSAGAFMKIEIVP
ncbi:MAG: hypothetical protein ACXW2I_10685 [Burkholderiales bacterium]